MLVDLHGNGKSPPPPHPPLCGYYVDCNYRKGEKELCCLTAFAPGWYSLSENNLTKFIHFHPAAVVLRFKLLDNMNFVGKEPELTPQDPLDKSSANNQL